MHEQGAINSEYMGHGGRYRDVSKRYSAVTGDPWQRECYYQKICLMVYKMEQCSEYTNSKGSQIVMCDIGS
jgi:hypothetical protein